MERLDVRRVGEQRRERGFPEVCQSFRSFLKIIIFNVSLEVHRGASARELFLQAYQFILWKQCYAFIHTVGIPADLENVVKDLWALRLQLLKDKTDATFHEDVVFSSQAAMVEGEQEDDREKHKKMLNHTMPSLVDSLGLCYIAMTMLRLPVSVGDLHRWAVREDVPFIRAIRLVPPTIKQKLPSEYLRPLDTTTTLEPDQLREAINNLGLFYKHHFAISLPSLNAPLMLFKYIRDLSLPISLFSIVQRMAALLEFDFSYSRLTRYQRVHSYPEMSLIGLLVIAVKLYHPFDGLPRVVTSLNDPAVLHINWSRWMEAHRDHEYRIQAGAQLVRGSEIYVSEEDVMQMSGDQLDDYLDWYERTWIDEDRARHKTRPLDEDFRKWFPTGRQDGSAAVNYDFTEQRQKEHQSAQRLAMDVIQALELRAAINQDEGDKSGLQEIRIGDHYNRYKSYEDLTANALAFHEASAIVVGSKLETLLRTVLQIEEKLMNWRTEQLAKAEDEILHDGMHSPFQRDDENTVAMNDMDTNDSNKTRSRSNSV